MNIEQLLDIFKDDIWVPEDLTDAIWYEDDCYNLCWNTDGSVGDLSDLSGMSYSECIYEAVESNGFILYTMGDSCGGKFQAFFSLDKKVDPNQFEEV